MAVSKCNHQFWNRYENSKTGERFNICPLCGLRVQLTQLNVLRTGSKHVRANVTVTRISPYVSVV